MSKKKQSRVMKKIQFQKLINKKLQVYEVRIELQGCLIDILITKIDTLANPCINRNK
jgi:hypothetical protein